MVVVDGSGDGKVRREMFYLVDIIYTTPMKL